MRPLMPKKKKRQPTIQYSAKIAFKNKGKTNKYLDNQKMGEFIGLKTTPKNTEGSSSSQ